MATEQLSIRPVRPADRSRVLEMVAEIWEGRDYIPLVFDEWVADPSAFFQAGELDGELVAIQRLRPIAEGLIYYGGLRVASSHRRQGVGREMLRFATAEARRLGFKRMRLATGVEEARGLFEAERFALELRIKFWRAGRIEGGDPPSLLRMDQVAAAFSRLEKGDALAAYNRLLPDPEEPLELDAVELQRLAEAGSVKQGPGGQALAVTRPLFGNWGVLFVSGHGAALQELMLSIRYEADAEGREIRLLTPDPHPAEEDLEAAGYDWREHPARFYFYSLDLS